MPPPIQPVSVTLTVTLPGWAAEGDSPCIMTKEQGMNENTKAGRRRVVTGDTIGHVLVRIRISHCLMIGTVIMSPLGYSPQTKAKVGWQSVTTKVKALRVGAVRLHHHSLSQSAPDSRADTSWAGGRECSPSALDGNRQNVGQPMKASQVLRTSVIHNSLPSQLWL